MAATQRTSTNGHGQKRDDFSVTEVIKDPDGVIATITERTRDGRISFTIARQYDTQGQTKETKYLSARHIPAVVRLLGDLQERLEAHEDRARAKRR